MKYIASILFSVLLLVACPAQPQGLDIVDLTIATGAEYRTAIYLNGDTVSTAKLVIGFTPSEIRLHQIEDANPWLDTSYVTHTPNTDSATMTIALADTVPFTGLLAYLTMDSGLEKDWKTTLYWQRAELDSLNDVALHDGLITIRPYDIPELDGDDQITMGDVLWLWRVTSRLFPHEIWQSYPGWQLERMNIHEDYLPNGYPKLDLLDVVDFARNVNEGRYIKE